MCICQTGGKREILDRVMQDGLTIRKYKSATVQPDVIDLIQDLIEEMDEGNWVGIGAVTVVDAGHVFNVAVVWLVQISTIPAALEMDLSSKTVLTIGLGHVVRLLATGTIEAGEVHAIRDGAFATRNELIRLVGSSGFVTRDHAESRGERSQSFVAAPAQVINDHAAVGDLLERAVGMLVVHGWSPIGRLIILDLTRAAGSLQQGFISGLGVNVGSS